jgi:hypothetical protein
MVRGAAGRPCVGRGSGEHARWQGAARRVAAPAGSWPAGAGAGARLAWRAKLAAEIRPGVMTEADAERIGRGEEAGLADPEPNPRR